MKVKYLSETFGTFSSRGIKFVSAGDVQEISKTEGQRLIETWPDKFEEVKGTSSKKSASEEKDDSDQLAPASSEAGANDLSETQNTILNVIRENQPLKLTNIAENMGINWQSIRADIQLLLDSNLISKDYDNQYTLKS